MALRFGCGPAAGRIAIFKITGFSVRQEDLHFYMNTVDGYTFPTNFAKAMRHYGLRAKLYHPMSIDYFKKRLEQPYTVIACAFWNHWYVATNVADDNRITFYSGIEGKRIMSLREFEMVWIDKTAALKPVVNLGIIIRKAK